MVYPILILHQDLQMSVQLMHSFAVIGLESTYLALQLWYLSLQFPEVPSRHSQLLNFIIDTSSLLYFLSRLLFSQVQSLPGCIHHDVLHILSILLSATDHHILVQFSPTAVEIHPRLQPLHHTKPIQSLCGLYYHRRHNDVPGLYLLGYWRGSNGNFSPRDELRRTPSSPLQ